MNVTIGGGTAAGFSPRSSIKNDEQDRSRSEPTMTLEQVELSANAGNSDAQCALGIIYSNGLRVERDEAKAVKYFELSAEQGHEIAQEFMMQILGGGLTIVRNSDALLQRLYAGIKT